MKYYFINIRIDNFGMNHNKSNKFIKHLLGTKNLNK